MEPLLTRRFSKCEIGDVVYFWRKWLGVKSKADLKGRWREQARVASEREKQPALSAGEIRCLPETFDNLMRETRLGEFEATTGHLPPMAEAEQALEKTAREDARVVHHQAATNWILSRRGPERWNLLHQSPKSTREEN